MKTQVLDEKVEWIEGYVDGLLHQIRAIREIYNEQDEVDSAHIDILIEDMYEKLQKGLVGSDDRFGREDKWPE
jgi:hypothetical protein